MSGENELVLGIESSCDETAAAVLCGGRKVLSMAVHTQIPVHRLYGGVVPGNCFPQPYGADRCRCG